MRRVRPRQLRFTAAVLPVLRAEGVSFAEAVAAGKGAGWHRLNLPHIPPDLYGYERQVLNALDNGLTALCGGGS